MTKITYSIKSIHKILRNNKPSKVYIVTSQKLKENLGWAIEKMNVPRSNIILLPDGEKAKTWKELERLLKKFSDIDLDRSSIVVVLGGGTIGDVTGFAASIYLRGIKYVQVPTTLLAQVDSAHGGKTGINFLGYKNQIGSFYSPIATIIDTKFLESLSNEQIVDGLGEIIKAAIIKDQSILSLLGKHTIKSIVKSSDLIEIINKSIAVKNYFTAKDFKDNESRQILNFGHTIGHALELKYKINHGRAVIVGMLQELEFTEKLGLTKPSVRKSLLYLFKHLGIKIDTNMKAEWKAIVHDKKVSGGKISFPVVEREGKVSLVNLDLKSLREFLFSLPQTGSESI